MPLELEILKEQILSVRNETISTTAEVLRCNLQYEDTEKTIISNVNILLNAAQTRANGLKLLDKIIAYCSSTVVQDNASIWLNHCLKPLPQDKMKEIKLETLTHIIEVACFAENFNKKIVTENLSDILKLCLSGASCEDAASIKCLSQCMQQFPAWFGNHNAKIQPFLENFLENSTRSTVEEAAIAFHYFQQTGSAGAESINYTNNFRQQFIKLCATLHSLYDNFFQGVGEVDQTERIESETFAFPPLASNLDSCEALELYSRRIINCLIFLKTMIVKKFPAPKQFVPKYLIDVVTRGLSLHICVSDEQVSKHTNTLSLELNKIQMELLNFLHPLFAGHFLSILPFSHVLSKMLVNTLKRLHSCRCFATNRLYSETCYKTLDMWLLLSKSCDPAFLSMLIPVLIQQMVPKKRNIRLNSTSTGKNKSRKRGHDAGLKCPEMETNYPTFRRADFVRKKNCLEAARIVKTLLENTVIDHRRSEELALFVVKTLMDINRHQEVAPYNNISCQVALYNVLIAFLKQPDLGVVPPLNYTVEILNAGLHGWSREIVSVCQKGLDLAEKISQPVCPTLQLKTETAQRSAQNANQSVEILKINELSTPDAEEVEMVASKESSIASDIAIASPPNVDDLDFENDTSLDVTDAILKDTIEAEVVSPIIEEDVVANVESEAVEHAPVSLVTKIVCVSNGDNKEQNGHISIEKRVATQNDDEPFEKKNKLDDPDLNDMFNSFQNIIQ